jgi:hypothetical protein
VYKAGPLCTWLLHKGPVFRFRPGEGHDLLFREGSMPHGRDALAARFARARSAKCGRAPTTSFARLHETDEATARQTDRPCSLHPASTQPPMVLSISAFERTPISAVNILTPTCLIRRMSQCSFLCTISLASTLSAPIGGRRTCKHFQRLPSCTESIGALPRPTVHFKPDRLEDAARITSRR